MTDNKHPIPEFHSAEEEARWWESNQDALTDALAEAAETGILQQGTLSKERDSQ